MDNNIKSGRGSSIFYIFIHFVVNVTSDYWSRIVELYFEVGISLLSLLICIYLLFFLCMVPTRNIIFHCETCNL